MDPKEIKNAFSVCIGPIVFKLIYAKFNSLSVDEKLCSDIIDFLEQYFKPATNIHAIRTQFYNLFVEMMNLLQNVLHFCMLL